MFTGVAALVLYLLACALLLLSFKARRAQTPFYVLLWAAFCAHLYFLYRVIDTPSGQNLHIFNLLSLITVLWVGIVAFANLRTRLKSLFVVVLPLAALSLIPLLTRVGRESPVLNMALGQHPWALSHILIALAAYALLGVAFLQAVALALQRWYLSHAPAHNALPVLPPLEAMHTLMLRVLFAAFIALTLALGLGVVAHGVAPMFYSVKNVGSLLVWGLCAGLLVLYHGVGLKVRYAIVGIALAWIGLSVAYVGMKL